MPNQQLEAIAKRIPEYEHQLEELEKELAQFSDLLHVDLVDTAVQKRNIARHQLVTLKKKAKQADLDFESGTPGGPQDDGEPNVINDDVLAEEWQDHLKDVDQLTAGQIDAKDLQTKGKDDEVQIAHDEALAKEWQGQLDDVGKITSGQANAKDLQTKGQTQGNDDADLYEAVDKPREAYDRIEFRTAFRNAAYEYLQNQNLVTTDYAEEIESCIETMMKRLKEKGNSDVAQMQDCLDDLVNDVPQVMKKLL